MSQQQLAYEITKLSTAGTWEVAVSEWKLNTIYFSDTPTTCLCGHFPVKEICVVHNKLNGHSAEVGNCCVKKFMGLPSDLIFQAIKRIQVDSKKSLNAEALNYAKQKNWMNDWEVNFYTNICGKRVLTPKQAAKKQQVNAMILRKIQYTPKNS